MTNASHTPLPDAVRIAGDRQRNNLNRATRWARATTLAASVAGVAGLSGLAFNATNAMSTTVEDVPTESAASTAVAPALDIPSQSLFTEQGPGAALGSQPSQPNVTTSNQTTNAPPATTPTHKVKRRVRSSASH